MNELLNNFVPEISTLNYMVVSVNRLRNPGIFVALLFIFLLSCGDSKTGGGGKMVSVLTGKGEDADENYKPVYAMLVAPGEPRPGESFRIISTGGRDIDRATVVVTGPSYNRESHSGETGDELPYWRIDEFTSGAEGVYRAVLKMNGNEITAIDFKISGVKAGKNEGVVWKAEHGWDSSKEALYSAWVNALFKGSNESSSWKSLSEVTQNREHNFLYNYLSLDEDNPDNKNTVFMQPDCADNPFFLRAYFAWKLGLPFGYHICDRGYLGKNPGTGQWVTNETVINRADPVQRFNTFLRMVMNGVHSGTARTAIDNENSDYYPVALDRLALRPGTVYADPYGHTLILVGWVPQTKGKPGLLLSVDAQPDGTIAIKRFWKGNFLFNTSEVVGEPGFKAFRPIITDKGSLRALKNKELTEAEGYVPFSMQQRKMESEDFYNRMERLINPRPLDPEDALADLVNALYEQLQVRVISVENGEAYFRSHPGAVIPMPSNANAIFQAGGQWEDFSTPNRDLRLLIAMDAVVDFPQRVASAPADFGLSADASPEKIKDRLQSLLDKKAASLSIKYTRSDGSPQELTLAEILKRRDSFEVAYNPNDGAEIRWGAPEGSAERAACRRHAPQSQQKTMQSVRKWFSKRLHPPT